MKAPFSRIKRSEFATILSGRTVRGSQIELKYAPFPGRIAYTFVVSGKVAPLAVDRNRLKRRGRAILQKLSKKLAAGYGLAFFYKKGAPTLRFSEIEAEITTLLSQASLIPR